MKDPYVLPDKPAAIVCPNSTFENWKREISKWTKPGLLAVFEYRGAKRKDLFAKGGEFWKCNHPMSQRVVLVSLSVSCILNWKIVSSSDSRQALATDIGLVTKPHSTRDWNDQEPLEILGYDDEYVERFGTMIREYRHILRALWSRIIFDESHNIRNKGNSIFEAAYRMAENADFTVCMTATLIYTGPTVSSLNTPYQM